MQRVIIIFLVIVTAALTWWALDLRGRLVAAEGVLFSLHNEYGTLQKAANSVKAEAEPLKANIARLTEERDQAKMTAKLQPATELEDAAQVEKPEAKEGGLLDGLLQSMDSPAMRQMMRGQAVSAARKEYAGLIKNWRLSATETEQFLQLMADRDSFDTSGMTDFLKGGTLDEKKMAEMEKKEALKKKESEARLKSLLGEQRAGELEKFETEKEQLAAVLRYTDHLTTAGFPLDAKQQTELGNILRDADGEAVGKMPSQRKLEEANALNAGFSDDSIAAARKKDEEYQSRVVSRAAGLLNPDQVSALQAAFKEENDEKEMGMKFAGQMMKNGALKDVPPGAIDGKVKAIESPKLVR